MTKTKLLPVALLACVCSYAQVAERFDVVITEMMADPTPVVGLPNAEYVEIKNVSGIPFNMSGWKLSDATGTATISTSFVLQPDSIVILCTNSNVAAFSVFGRTIGVASFPSLDNDGDVLILRSPQNKVIHTINYTTAWYGNEAKKDGGWSLEVVDPENPCGGKSNWKASVSNLGGTPGKTNSVNGVNTDDIPPQLKRAYVLDNITLVLVFDESLDSSSAVITANYSLPGNSINGITALPPSFQTVQLKLSNPLLTETVYDLTVSNLKDCKGNVIGAYNKTKVGMPQAATPSDIIVNEILFNPKPGGNDYVELYNKSNKVIDVSQLYIANRNNNNVVSSLKKFSEEAFYIFPGDYAVITEDAASLNLQYLVKNGNAVLAIPSLPSFPDDKGVVVLINLNGDIIDEVNYNDDWHFGLIDNVDGVAVERIDPAGSSGNKNNWHSAAASVGYGTPTYKNSQYKLVEEVAAMITVSPKIFSPDNDGVDDITTISYRVEESGYVANVIVFDAMGRTVRHLIKNELLGLVGQWNWDGLGEKNNKLPIGSYIIFSEMFNLEGKKKSFKKTITLARRLN